MCIEECRSWWQGKYQRFFFRFKIERWDFCEQASSKRGELPFDSREACLQLRASHVGQKQSYLQLRDCTRIAICFCAKRRERKRKREREREREREWRETRSVVKQRVEDQIMLRLIILRSRERRFRTTPGLEKHFLIGHSAKQIVS